MKANKTILCLLVACLSLHLFGCDRGPALQFVEGTVTLDGKPCANCVISFMPKDGGELGFARTDEEGKYRLSSHVGKTRAGTTIGTYGICLDKRTVDPAVHPKASPDNPVQLLPKKYTDGATSGFEITVEKGKNVHDFDMFSK